MSEQVTSLIRSILKFGGGYLVAKGTVDAGTADIAIGAGATLIGVLWSIFFHSKKA